MSDEPAVIDSTDSSNRSSTFVDPELLKPKKSFADEKPSFATVQLKSSGFKDPELERPKKTTEETPIFAKVSLRSSVHIPKEAEAEKPAHRAPAAEDTSSHRQSTFKDPELEKPKKVTEETPIFAKVSLRPSSVYIPKEIKNIEAEKPSPSSHRTSVAEDTSSHRQSTFKDPELEKPKKAAEAPPSFAKVTLKATGVAAATTPTHKEPEPERSSHRASAAEDTSSHRQSTFKDPELEKKRTPTTEAPVFASVQLKRSSTITEEKPKVSHQTSRGHLDTKAEEPEKPVFSVSLKKAAVAPADLRGEVANISASPAREEKKPSFYDTVVSLKKATIAPADLKGEVANVSKSPLAPEKKEEVPAFVGVKLRSVAERARSKVDASEDRSAKSSRSEEHEKPSFASVPLKRAESTKSEAKEEKEEPAFAGHKLRSSTSFDNHHKEEKKNSLYDVPLKKTGAAPADLRGDTANLARSPSFKEKKEEVPIFAGVKLKRAGESAEKPKEEVKGLSQTRKLPSEDNLKYLEHTGEGPVPTVEIVPKKTIQKSQSFTRRVPESN